MSHGLGEGLAEALGTPCRWKGCTLTLFHEGRCKVKTFKANGGIDYCTNCHAVPMADCKEGKCPPCLHCSVGCVGYRNAPRLDAAGVLR